MKGCAALIGIGFVILIVALVVGLAVGGDDPNPQGASSQPDVEEQIDTATTAPSGSPTSTAATPEEPSGLVDDPAVPPAPPSTDGLVKTGTHQVGRDIEPGEYTGDASSELLGTCYWARLSGTSGEFEDLIANDNAQGVFYVTVVPSDYALQTGCDLRFVPEGEGSGAGPDSSGSIAPGTYKVNVDIEPGEYTGDASSESLETCYWARLSGTSGEFEDVIANDIAQGVFYLTVMPSDYALQTGCDLRLVQDA